MSGHRRVNTFFHKQNVWWNWNKIEWNWNGFQERSGKNQGHIKVSFWTIFDKKFKVMFDLQSNNILEIETLINHCREIPIVMDTASVGYKRSKSLPPFDQKLQRGEQITQLRVFVNNKVSQSDDRKLSAPPEEVSYCVNCHGSHRYVRHSEQGQQIDMTDF